MDLENKAATVEGAFVLQPPKRIKKTLTALPADLHPTVGVAVTLRREEVSPQVQTPRKGFVFYSKQVFKVLIVYVIKCANLLSHVPIFPLPCLPLVKLKICTFSNF